jgi:hypothetical protein
VVTNDGTDGPKNSIPTVNRLLAIHQQALDALNGAVKLALEGAQTIVNRYEDFVSEAHRQFAVLQWRGTVPRNADGEESSSVEVAQGAIDTTFAHAVALTEIATKLQLESLTVLRHSALDSLKLFEPHLRDKSKHPGSASGLDAT